MTSGGSAAGGIPSRALSRVKRPSVDGIGIAAASAAAPALSSAPSDTSPAQQLSAAAVDERARVRAARMRRIEELAAAARIEDAAKRAAAEEAELRHIREQATSFRARPVDPRVLAAAPALPAVQHKPPTVARSPSLATKARSRRSSSIAASASAAFVAAIRAEPVMMPAGSSSAPDAATSSGCPPPVSVQVGAHPTTGCAPPFATAAEVVKADPTTEEVVAAVTSPAAAEPTAVPAPRGRTAAPTAFGLRIAGALRKPNVPTAAPARSTAIKPGGTAASVTATALPTAVPVRGTVSAGGM
jgi:translation initiation factor IF-2